MRTIFLLILVSGLSYGKTWDLTKGQASYEISHFIKRVSGISKDLKGKIQCDDKSCEFLVAVPVKSFTSSDSNRDQNMFHVTEAEKYPYAIARGKILNGDLFSESKVKIPVEVEFHGIRVVYEADISMNIARTMHANLTIDLEKHKIERPSFLGIKIDREGPLQFEFEWSTQ